MNARQKTQTTFAWKEWNYERSFVAVSIPISKMNLPTMKYMRLLLIIILTLALLTFLVEMIELALVVIASGQSFAVLSQNQDVYFECRNQTSILLAKPVYTFLSAFFVSYLGSRFLKSTMAAYFIAISIIQTAGISYGAFLSEFKDSLSTWYWFLISLMILGGFLMAYLMKSRSIKKKDGLS